MNRSVPDFDGPVTSMFTDVEGSTNLRTTLGDAQSDALFHEHNELIRAEIEAHGGHDQSAALGDGFLAVFTSTRRAVGCAIAIQRALDASNRRRTGPELRVRIGLNTGEVAMQDGQLSGEAIHAAARVCARAEGGQILVSDVTRQLAGTMPDVTFVNAGDHDLKGFPQQWRLWEVVWVRETSPAPERVFIGRDAELAFLRTKLSDALEGRGGLVLVGGEPGVGKTTLVKRLIDEAEPRGAFSVLGRCYESEGAVPYSPFVEMLEQALGVLPAETVREDMAEDAPEVARMVPVLRRRFPDIGEPLDLPPEQQRRFFFNALRSFLGRAQERFTIVLVIDDVHWADEPTLLLIEHLAERLSEMRVLIIGTYRDVALDVSRPLAGTMERLLRSRLADRLPVHRFDRETVGYMVRRLAGQEPPEELIDVIFAETEGNPFFVEEIFRHLVEEGKVFDDAGAFRHDVRVDELDVPESVRLVVGRRLERLGPQAQKALAAAAVIGRAFPFALLEQISGVEPAQLLDIVDEAELARVILPEERAGDAHYTFAHELVRQTLLGTVSLPRRQRLHLAVAEAIERIDPDAPDTRPSEIADHLLHAGAAADRQRTVAYLERAADRAYEGAAFEEVVRSVDAALQLVGSGDVRRQTQLRDRLGWALRALGRFEECIATWDEVVESYRASRDDERAAHLCEEMAYQLLWLGRFEDSFMVLQRGLDMVGDQQMPVRGRLLAQLGSLLGLSGLLEQAESSFAEAAEIGRDLGDDTVLGAMHWTRSVSLVCHLRMEEAAEAGRSAAEHLERSGQLWSLCDARGWRSLALAFGGRPQDALSLAAEGRHLAVRLGHVGAQIILGRAESIGPLSRGDLDAYERLARLDLELCESIRSPWIAQSYAWLAIALELRGDLDEALALHDRAIPLEPASAFTGFTLAGRLLNRAYAGATGEFLDQLAEAQEAVVGRTEPLQLGAATVRSYTVMGAVMLDLPQQAAELYAHVAARTEDAWVTAFGCYLSERVAGMAAAAAERWEEAESHFERALRQARDAHRADEPQVQHWYGKMLLDRGRQADRERARQMIGSAIQGYRTMGMPVLQQMAEALQR